MLVVYIPVIGVKLLVGNDLIDLTGIELYTYIIALIMRFLLYWLWNRGGSSSHGLLTFCLQLILI